MEITIAWYWLIVILFLAVCIPWLSLKAYDKEIEELTNREDINSDEKTEGIARFSRVDANSINEVKNMVEFLKKRDQILALNTMKVEMSSEHWIGQPLDCDYVFLEKGEHPALLAFVRSAHLAGCTVSVREKRASEIEQVTNSNIVISECVTKIYRTDFKDEKETEDFRDKKSKYGYYK